MGERSLMGGSCPEIACSQTSVSRVWLPRAASADSLHLCRPRLLGVPAAGLHGALQLHRDRPSRLGRERQAARPVLDRRPCRPGRRLPQRHRDRQGPCRWHVVRRRRGYPPGRPPSRPRALALLAQRLAGSDDYLKIVVEQWRTLATTLPTVADVVIQAIFPWCFTPDMWWSGRSSSRRWWTSCVAAPPSRWTRSWPRPMLSSPTTPARHWARSTLRP